MMGNVPFAGASAASGHAPGVALKPARSMTSAVLTTLADSLACTASGTRSEGSGSTGRCGGFLTPGGSEREHEHPDPPGLVAARGERETRLLLRPPLLSS